MAATRFLVFLLSTLIVVHGQTWRNVPTQNCRPLPNCCTWSRAEEENTTDSATPLGFRASTLPNPEDMLSNPCISATATNTNQHVSVAVEGLSTLGNNRLCIVVNGNLNNQACGVGQTRYCDKVTQTSLNITIYCDTGCTLSSVNFFYKVNFSSPDVSDDEYWCDTAVDYPSSLIQVIPPETVTQQTTVPDAGYQLYSSTLLLVATLIMAVMSFGVINLI